MIYTQFGLSYAPAKVLDASNKEPVNLEDFQGHLDEIPHPFWWGRIDERAMAL